MKTILIKVDKMKTFWFHYNRHASKKAGKPKITVHYDGKCHIVDNIGPCLSYGDIRKRQPHFVMKGKCKEIQVIKGIAYVNQED